MEEQLTNWRVVAKGSFSTLCLYRKNWKLHLTVLLCYLEIWGWVGEKESGKRLLLCFLCYIHRNSYQNISFQNIFLLWSTVKNGSRIQRHTKGCNEFENQKSREKKAEVKKKTVSQIRLGILGQENLYACVILPPACSQQKCLQQIFAYSFLSGLFSTLN